MEYLSLMAPVAFVFALVALNHVTALKKEVEQLKTQIEELKK